MFWAVGADVGQGVRGRQYPWGFASCEDVKHSDLGALRRCLLIEVRRSAGDKASCAARPRIRRGSGNGFGRSGTLLSVGALCCIIALAYWCCVLVVTWGVTCVLGREQAWGGKRVKKRLAYFLLVMLVSRAARGWRTCMLPLKPTTRRTVVTSSRPRGPGGCSGWHGAQ